MHPTTKVTWVLVEVLWLYPVFRCARLSSSVLTHSASKCWTALWQHNRHSDLFAISSRSSGAKLHSLWNILPVEICQLSPDSFKAQLSTIQLMWTPASLVFNPLHRTVFICSCVAFICTAVSTHCLQGALLDRRHGATLLGFQLAPYVDEDEEDRPTLHLVLFATTVCAYTADEPNEV